MSTDPWKRFLLFERIRAIADAEFRSTSKRIFYDGVEIEELMHDAKRAYEDDKLDACERLCERAEVLFLIERGKVFDRIRMRGREIKSIRTGVVAQ